MQTATPEMVKRANATMVNNLSGSQDSEGFRKSAADLDSYTKYRLREEGIWDKIQPFEPITNEDLQPQLGERSDDLVVYKEIEEDSPGAITGTLDALPEGDELRGRRYPINLVRVISNKFYKNVDRLRTWKMDLRKLAADLQVYDVVDQKDRMGFATAIRAAAGKTGGVANTTADNVNDASGVVQWETIPDGISRESLVDGAKILMRTPSSLLPKMAVANTITMMEVIKFDRIEAGGDSSEELLQSGKISSSLLGLDWIASIKRYTTSDTSFGGSALSNPRTRNVIPDGRVHYFAASSYMGQAVELEAPTMQFKKEAFNVEFWISTLCGLTIANPNSCAIADFEGVG